MLRFVGEHSSFVMPYLWWNSTIVGDDTFLIRFSFTTGRVNVKAFTKKAKKELSREQRKNKCKQMRKLKRDETASRKRALGTAGSPPFLVTVVPLSPNINPRTALKTLTACEDGATVTTSSQGIVHLRYQ